MIQSTKVWLYPKSFVNYYAAPHDEEVKIGMHSTIPLAILRIPFHGPSGERFEGHQRYLAMIGVPSQEGWMKNKDHLKKRCGAKDAHEK